MRHLQIATSKRVRAALFLSVADVFFGTGALILSLIVLSSVDKKEDLIERYVDAVVECDFHGNQWRVKTKSNITESISNWIKTTTKDGLLQRIGIEVERNEMPCFQLIKKAASKHNKNLMKRGHTASTLSVIFLPSTLNDEKNSD